jgi:hypothetical protein
VWLRGEGFTCTVIPRYLDCVISETVTVPVFKSAARKRIADSG